MARFPARTRIALAIIAVVACLLLYRCWHEAALFAVVRGAATSAQVAEAVVGMDLKGLPEATRHRVLDALRELTGEPGHWRGHQDGSPHRLLAWHSGTTRWVLVVTYEGMDVPDASWMAIHQFDADWRQTSVVNFPTGYRIALFDVWKQDVEALVEPVIAVRLGSVGSFGDFSYRQRQYYVVRDKRVVMVRIEEEGEELERAIFSARHPWNGPAVPSRQVADWIGLLASPDPVDVLEVLTWLGGHHMDSATPRRAGVNEESIEDSRRWEAVRDDPRTAPALTTLADSGNPWVRDAARLAARRQ